MWKSDYPEMLDRFNEQSIALWKPALIEIVFKQIGMN